MRKIIFLILFLSFTFNFAQELEAKVMVNYEQLETRYRDKLNGFAYEIEDYLNSNKFTGNLWEWEKIKCSFNIFFTQASNDVNYVAQVVVSSQRRIGRSERFTLMMSILDNSWSFTYEPGRTMYFNETEFDNLTSLLDFYAFLIIGFDSDSYDKFGGTEMFNKAYNVAMIGSTQNAKGWILKRNTYNKYGIVDEILNAKYNQFREDYKDYHLNGVDLYRDKKELAQKNIVKLIENLYRTKDKRDAKSILLKVFFDAKHKEIIEYTKDLKDPELYNKLKIVDPAHILKYNEVADTF